MCVGGGGSCSSKMATSALNLKIVGKCSTSRARAADMTLPHSVVQTPIFMPVGTQGTLKGIIPEQLEALDCRIMLANTYHLGNRPGEQVLKAGGGLHKFMNWPRSLLTDSGGFQMVSLSKLTEITEEGVNFESPYDGSKCMLTPERSIEIQQAIGADIMMQLDDVVDSTCKDEDRFEEARHRTVRWLDRCIEAHTRPDKQNLFPIVQGGLDEGKRKDCADQLTKRNVPGFAIGGLSGGEDKSTFCRIVKVSAENLPDDKPRYVMGVGHQVDIIACVALGSDMFDCVFPTRTARFGSALVFEYPGELQLKKSKFKMDFRPIDENCDCSTCQNYTRAYLHTVVTKEPSACHLVSIHNVAHQLRLMKRARDAIIEDKFPQFVAKFMLDLYPDKKYPDWAQQAFQGVGISLEE
eukprot:TRINITY_DN2172_c0_g1_i4.p1 TRINITY_DN2172_c0_g1~~TRINITY_DN2172_c0_g1_i4.p1  ORF type:complete len:409 (+),score=68.12 TRINITY_DN2172_c0_g1_i4:43-1269(+)